MIGVANTWCCVRLPALQHGAVLPAYVGVWGVTPGFFADSSWVPTVVVWVLQLWDDIHRQTVLVGNLKGKTEKYRGEKNPRTVDNKVKNFCWPLFNQAAGYFQKLIRRSIEKGTDGSECWCVLEKEIYVCTLEILLLPIVVRWGHLGAILCPEVFLRKNMFCSVADPMLWRGIKKKQTWLEGSIKSDQYIYCLHV